MHNLSSKRNWITRYSKVSKLLGYYKLYTQHIDADRSVLARRVKEEHLMNKTVTFDYAISSIKLVQDVEHSNIVIMADLIKQQQWHPKIELITLSKSMEPIRKVSHFKSVEFKMACIFEPNDPAHVSGSASLKR
jgi:hypothetical protein